MIQANVKYVITAIYPAEENPTEGPKQYVDTFETLKRVIATTWSQRPHQVYIKDNIVEVVHGIKRLAQFEFSSLPTLALPDHL